MSSPSDALYLHIFVSAQIPYKKLTLLWEQFGSWERAYHSPTNSLTPLLSPLYIEELKRLKTIPTDSFQAKLTEQRIKIVCHTDPSYPFLLSQISDPPFLLYYQGLLPKNQEVCVSIVGMRDPSFYGKQTTAQFTKILAQAGLTIVSGLAYGIDALAHHTAIQEKAKTVAVLAGGLSLKYFYPKANLGLAQKMLKTGGCIISEYPPDTRPQKHHFVARNRIIAGLSRATLITEAKLKSGSLITADFAVNENRLVLAVPGSVLSPHSAGTNNLIKAGAIPITNTQDLFDTLNLPHAPTSENSTNQKLSPEESIILNALNHEPQSIDKLIHTRIDTHTLTTALTYLEIKKLIKNTGNNQYVKI